MRLQNRAALVTGGSGGIGAAICRGLAKEGSDVAVHYFHNAQAAQGVQAKGGSSSIVETKYLAHLHNGLHTVNFWQWPLILSNSLAQIRWKLFFSLSSEHTVIGIPLWKLLIRIGKNAP